MVFRRLRKRGRDRARSSERRRLGKAFQKDGPTTAKLLRWAVASLTLGTTRSPCSAERRDLRPGKDDTGTQSSLRDMHHEKSGLRRLSKCAHEEECRKSTRRNRKQLTNEVIELTG